MGTYNLTCGVTQVPIKTGDEAYFILLKETFGNNYCYNNERFTPISFPLLCYYDEDEGLEFKCSEKEEKDIIKMMNKGMSANKDKLGSFRSIDELNDLLDTRKEFVYFDAHHVQSYNNTKKEKEINYMVVHKSVYEMMSTYENEYYAGKLKKEREAIELLQSGFGELIDYIVEAANFAKENTNKVNPANDFEKEFKKLKTWREHFSNLPLYSIKYWDIDNDLEKNLKENTLNDAQSSFLKSSLEFYFENIYDVSPEFKEVFMVTPKFKFQRFTPLEHTLHCYGTLEFIKNVCLSNNKNYIDSYLAMGIFNHSMDNLAMQYLPQVTNFAENYENELFDMIAKESLNLSANRSDDSIEDTLWGMASGKIKDDAIENWIITENELFEGLSPKDYAQKVNVSFGIDEIKKHLGNLEDIPNED